MYAQHVLDRSKRPRPLFFFLILKNEGLVELSHLLLSGQTVWLNKKAVMTQQQRGISTKEFLNRDFEQKKKKVDK